MTLPSFGSGTAIGLDLVAYVALWGLGLAGVALVAYGLFSAKAPAGDEPLLFFRLRQVPKAEALLAVGVALALPTAMVALWRMAHGASMGDGWGEWLLFVGAMVGLSPAFTLGKRATFKAEAVDAERATALALAPAPVLPDPASRTVFASGRVGSLTPLPALAPRLADARDVAAAPDARG